MTVGTFLRLGRVSNLPTVWTNALAGTVIVSNSVPDAGTMVIVATALTLFYIGGMWLNDAFDAEIDSRERANRPIPMGEISLGVVFTLGFVYLGLGILMSFSLGLMAGLAGLLLAGAVVLYDWLHKRTILSPVIMGATRFLSYILAAVAVSYVTTPLVLGAFGLFAYIIGLTYAAKQEAYDRIGAVWPLGVLAMPVAYAFFVASSSLLGVALCVAFALVVAFALSRLFRRLKGDVPTAVVTMIAGISLYDAALIAGTGQLMLALICAAGFALTLFLQRIASGT